MSAIANGTGLTWCRVTIPWSGVPIIECDAPEEITPVAGLVTFVIEDLIVVATMVRSGMFAGSWQGYGVAGKNGWGKQISAKGYTSPFGLLDSQIILDAARECGELPPIVQVPYIVGGFFIRRADLPASQVFSRLPPGTDWWVDPKTGITQAGVRVPAIATADFSLIDNNTRDGRLVIETDVPGAFQPGASFVDPLAGAFTVNAAVVTSNANKLKVEIWTA